MNITIQNYSFNIALKPVIEFSGYFKTYNQARTQRKFFGVQPPPSKCFETWVMSFIILILLQH